jgi:general secretion pathway protein B
MSYILNALRKSERERQAVEPDTVTTRILVSQPPQHQRSSKLIAALIISNLIIVAYFLWFTQKTQPVALLPPADTQPAAPMAKPTITPPAEAVPPKSEIRPPEPKAPSIAEIIETRTAALPQPPVKPAVVQKPLIEPVKPAIAPPRPVPQKAAPVKIAANKPEPKAEPLPVKQIEPAIAAITEPAPVSPPAKHDLPFLNELPAEFRRTVPQLPINVFVYSPVPAERFVMIDMVKYTPGQRIKDQLDLKEIRPDSLIVSYNNRLFKIKRP